MSKAFSPGSVTCLFQPEGSRGEDPNAVGSRGVGIKISAGATVAVEERADQISRILMGGEQTHLPVSRNLMENLSPGRGWDVYVENDVPSGQGFGMSAAGALALALCLEDDFGSAVEAAHMADICGGGGLGDVAVICGPGAVNIRAEPGLGPGKVIPTDLSFDRLALVVLGPKVNTGKVLADPDRRSAITEAGRTVLGSFMDDPSESALFDAARRFTELAGIMTPEVSSALSSLRSSGIRCGMCMLGDSIYAEASADEVTELLGEGVEAYQCRSTFELPHLIRTGCSAGRLRPRRKVLSWRPHLSNRRRSSRIRRR